VLHFNPHKPFPDHSLIFLHIPTFLQKSLFHHPLFPPSSTLSFFPFSSSLYPPSPPFFLSPHPSSPSYSRVCPMDFFFHFTSFPPRPPSYFAPSPLSVMTIELTPSYPPLYLWPVPRAFSFPDGVYAFFIFLVHHFVVFFALLSCPTI